MFPGVELTVGSDDDPAARAINAMGAKHVAKKVNVSLIQQMCIQNVTQNFVHFDKFGYNY